MDLYDIMSRDFIRAINRAYTCVYEGRSIPKIACALYTRQQPATLEEVERFHYYFWYVYLPEREIYNTYADKFACIHQAIHPPVVEVWGEKEYTSWILSARTEI